jgi:hypothetical protein
MAGEEGPFNRCITRSMTTNMRVAKEVEVFPAGEECALKQCQHGPMLKSCGTKRKAPIKVCNYKRKAAGGIHLYQGSGKKLQRLPQEEVDWILADRANEDRAPAEVKALRRLHRGLWPSLEEEEKTDGYGPRAYIETEEEFCKFQAWVRREYDQHGYVEVDTKLLAARAKVRSCSDQARQKELAKFDFNGHEDLKRFFAPL